MKCAQSHTIENPFQDSTSSSVADTSYVYFDMKNSDFDSQKMLTVASRCPDTYASIDCSHYRYLASDCLTLVQFDTKSVPFQLVVHTIRCEQRIRHNGS